MNHLLPSACAFRLDPTPDGALTLILDASESAAPHRAGIMHLCLATLADLPADDLVDLLFLGNPRHYPADQAPARLGTWFDENAPRASLITPVLEALAPHPQPDADAHAGRGPPSTIVLIGDGPIYDLDDWRDTPAWSRLRLVDFGAPLQPPGTGLPALNVPDPVALRHWLHEPVTRVEIRGPGFLPLAWDDPAYRLSEDQGRFSLTADRPPTGPMTVTALLCPNAALEVQRHRAGGRVETLSLPPRGEGREVGEPSTGPLTEFEIAILDLAIQGRDFTCPHCARPHPWDTLRCRAGRALIPQPVYPSLAHRAGFVLLSRHAAGASYRLLGDAMALGTDLAAIRAGTAARLVRFDPQDARWLPEPTAFTPYRPIGADGYGLLI